jgi:hypothetical protein
MLRKIVNEIRRFETQTRAQTLRMELPREWKIVVALRAILALHRREFEERDDALF